MMHKLGPLIKDPGPLMHYNQGHGAPLGVIGCQVELPDAARANQILIQSDLEEAHHIGQHCNGVIISISNRFQLHFF